MPTQTLKCGCTLDTDHVHEEHRPEGNPYHLAKKADHKPAKEEKKLDEEHAEEHHRKKH